MIQASSTGYLTRLFKLLTAHFNLDELRTLCFDLNVDYDTLRGEDKSTKALELISFMLREHRLNELVSTLRQQRPSADWPAEAEQPSPDELLAWATPGTLNAADYLAALRDYCANLPYLTLHDIRPPKTLDEVYVPLKARPQRRKDEKPKRDDERAMREMERSGPLSIADVMRQREPQHVLILGEPGAGKSTLLRQLAEHAWDTPDKISLNVPLLPILVPLRRLASAEGALEERFNRALTAELTLTQALPQGFFANWPRQTGANWLILLDALDEVPTEQRPQLMQWLMGLLNRIGQNRVVLTSRPSGYTQGELDDKLFGHYDLLAFTPDQAGEFARRWFNQPCEGCESSQGSAEHFLKELERVRAGALSGTPLLLTIAAKIYLEKGALPERRSGLYGQFVDIWLSEAEQRGLRAELGDPVCDVAKFALARLALAMTEQPSQTEAALVKVAADYLREAVPLSPERSETAGERFVKVMARRSGVFTRRGDAYDFIHPTFREYLAASAVVREYVAHHGQMRNWAISHWKSRDWREVVLFFLSIASDHSVDATEIVKHIFDTNADGMCFAAACAAEKVSLTSELQSQIVGELVYTAQVIDKLGDSALWSTSNDVITALASLRDNDMALKSLTSLMHNEALPIYIRRQAILAATSFKSQVVDSLRSLAHNEQQDNYVRLAAATALGNIGFVNEAKPVFLTAIYDETIYSWERMRALDEIVLYSGVQEVETLRRLAQDTKLDAEMRHTAASYLGQRGFINDAVTVLTELAREGYFVVDTLSQLSSFDTLVTLGCDTKIDATEREQAARILGNKVTTQAADAA